MKLWGGRFQNGTAALTDKFNGSIGFDHKLYREDIIGSMAHTKMLQRIGVLTDEEMKVMLKGLGEILDDVASGNLLFSQDQEDIHMNVETLLTAKIGETAKKLHTGRSRNDQVALDFRLYLKGKTTIIMGLLLGLMEVLKDRAEDHQNTIMPGYTHLQKAQPVTLAFHLMAYFQMFRRDYERFLDCYNRMDVMPLGSGAMAGVSYASDRQFLATELGFSAVSINAMDAVSDRDFAIEFMSAASISFMHMSRLAEELIIWSSNEFGYVTMDDAYSTGSSIMPQKKNPDVAELIRGKTGRIYGNLFTLLTVMKGLPMAYNKDMQEDKEPVFDTVETLEISLEIFAKMIQTLKFNEAKMRKAAESGFLNATDAADYLVGKGIPFRTAHEVVGGLVAIAEKEGKTLGELSMEVLKTQCSAFDADYYTAVSVEACINNRKSYGSTNFESVQYMLKDAVAYLGIEYVYQKNLEEQSV